jgi:hypothetical protein
MLRRSYPDTPAGHARQLRDADDARLAERGHRVKWRRGHGQRWLKGDPGFTGRCERCGDVMRVAAVEPGGAWRHYEDAAGKQHNMRKCSGRRR